MKLRHMAFIGTDPPIITSIPQVEVLFTKEALIEPVKQLTNKHYILPKSITVF